jgi:hypothetical protein
VGMRMEGANSGFLSVGRQFFVMEAPSLCNQ